MASDPDDESDEVIPGAAATSSLVIAPRPAVIADGLVLQQWASRKVNRHSRIANEENVSKGNHK